MVKLKELKKEIEEVFKVRENFRVKCLLYLDENIDGGVKIVLILLFWGKVFKLLWFVDIICIFFVICEDLYVLGILIFVDRMLMGFYLLLI